LISVALFGLGRIGISHLENLLRLQNFELKMVCDHKLELAQEVAERYGIPHYTNRPEIIFEDESIQAVLIVTSTTTHFELVTAALKAGKAVFVEKPLTIDIKQSLEIENVLRETNGFCQVGFMRRFDNDYMEAKRAIESGAIGKPLYFKAISRDPYAPPLSFIERSGGIFIDLMIHDIDLAHFLMGEKVTKVAAFGSVIKYPDFIKANDVDQALAFLEFESGCIGDIEGSRCAFYGYDVRTEIVGTDGTLLIGSNRKNNVSILTNTGNRHEIIPVFQERFTNAYINELSAFANCIAQQLPSTSSVEDSIRALKVAHAATSSFQQNGLLISTNA
jgi:scyllo-inositol 2-dehydrogenase (NAD+)